MFALCLGYVQSCWPLRENREREAEERKRKKDGHLSPSAQSRPKRPNAISIKMESPLLCLSLERGRCSFPLNHSPFSLRYYIRASLSLSLSLSVRFRSLETANQRRTPPKKAIAARRLCFYHSVASPPSSYCVAVSECPTARLWRPSKPATLCFLTCERDKPHRWGKESPHGRREN